MRGLASAACGGGPTPRGGAGGNGAAVDSPANAGAALRALEAERGRALVAVDVPSLERVLAPDLLYGHSNAFVETRSDLIARLRSGELRYLGFVPAVTTVQVTGDTALLRGTAAVRRATPSGPVDMALVYLAVYARRDGRWQMMGYQSTAQR